MRQRNDSGYGVDVMAWPTDDHPDWAPFYAADGQVVDFPEPLAGFTPVDAAGESEPKTKKTGRTAAATEGGEPA